MSTIEAGTTSRITQARGYVPRPSIRRTWPDVAYAFGIKRTLTGITFDEAIRRMRARPALFGPLTPEQIAIVQAYDGPWLGGRGASIGHDPAAE